MTEQAQGAESSDAGVSSLGLNAWLVEENYQEFLANPTAVDETWRELFESEHAPSTPRSGNGTPSQVYELAEGEATNGSSAPPAPAAIAAKTPPSPPRVFPGDGEPTPLRGAAARIVENMQLSLTVPTATSVHPIPASVLDTSRRSINEHLAATGGGKVSFTHLIAWAVVKALGEVPTLNSSFVADIDNKGTPGVVRHAHIGLGIAIDLEKSGGGRSLVVPAVKDADTLDFAGFVAAYEALVQKARSGSLGVEDFAGVTITITNPGTLGTTQSVPRLMSGQGAIIGVGALDYPAEYQGSDPTNLAALGIGKVVTLTSTYDHRIIQGAESGLFLKHIHELLVGEHGFYEEIFATLGVKGRARRVEEVKVQRSAPPEVSSTSEQQGPAGATIAQERLVDSTAHVPVSDLVAQLAVGELISAYRQRGHLAAHLDPLSITAPPFPRDLELESFGLSEADLEREFACGGLAGQAVMPLTRIVEVLKKAYCGDIGFETAHIQEPEELRFLHEQIENVPFSLDVEEKRYLLERLTAAEAFERFLQTRYTTQRRFSLEGGESTIPFLDVVLDDAVATGSTEAVLGMAHRGRLNALANIIGKPLEEIFADFEGSLDLATVDGSGDVKYHKGGAGTWEGRAGRSLRVTMPPNPSHLEAVDPVVEGVARAKQDHSTSSLEFPVLPILIHGDASMAGQGVVFETFNLSQLEGYRVGGTVHLVINNQLGFTTPPSSARSTTYPTEVAKSVTAPIFHVNGDDAEAVVRVARLAALYRRTFHKDVVVDIVCYRLHGHNEGDEPSYTQPLMYEAITSHATVRSLYAETLERSGEIGAPDADEILTTVTAKLQRALDNTRAAAGPHPEHLPERRRVELGRLSMATGVERPMLDAIAERLHLEPKGFAVHPKLVRQLAQRAELYLHDEVDWALGEALAFGSLVLEGTDVRLTGQDTRRGTFAHRHAVLVDYKTAEEYTPLASLTEAVGDLSGLQSARPGARFSVRDSLLSEYAALGFEYGYSVESANALVAWEAQFGDFVNGAQIVIDNFIVAAEEKWGQSSGLVLLLPHGYEGQGPEHSSTRIERFLSLCAGGNISVVQPTTAAQYFHLLRAQVRRTPRRPLVIVAPKSILRARQARSPISELVGGSFSEVLDDPARNRSIDNAKVRRIICCTGKIAFAAMERRDELVATGSSEPQSAIVRIEQLYPWPEAQLVDVVDRYPSAEEFIWLQDEPENMGAWTFVRDKIQGLYRDRYRIFRVSRTASGSPATGSHAIHDLEAQYLVDASVGASSRT